METGLKTLVMASLLFLPGMVAGGTDVEFPTTDLRVVGKLIVPTCTIEAFNNGVYDFGKNSATLIQPEEYIVFPTTTITQAWTVTCDAPTYLNFTPIDNRAASRSLLVYQSLGLGYVNTDGKLGYFTALAQHATVDGHAVQLFTTPTAIIAAGNTAWLAAGNKTGWASEDNTQVSGKVFITDISVTPVLASLAEMKGPISDTASIDGSVTLNFAYGL